MPTCEDLATKAELQELRDQLNAVIGEKEEGGAEVVFEPGRDPTIAAGLVAGTLLGTTKVRAATAIQDIVFNNPVYEPIHRDFANGNAKWTRVRGNGSRVPLPDLSKVGEVAGKASGTGTAAATVAAKSMGMVVVLANLANIAATIGLNIATVKVFDQRIDAESKANQRALDNLNQGMMRLYDKNQGNIEEANAEIARNRASIETASTNIARLETDAQQAKGEIRDLQGQLSDTRFDIQVLQDELIQTQVDMQTQAEGFSEALTELDSQITSINTSLTKALTVIEAHEAQLADNEARITELESTVQDLIEGYLQVDRELFFISVELQTLKQDLEEDRDLTNTRLSTIEGKIALTQKFVRAAGGGGGSGAALRAAADGQTKLLDLTSKLANNPTPVPTITVDNIINGTNPFTTTFDNLLPDVSPGQMDQQQLDDFKQQLQTNFDTSLDNRFSTLLIPRLDTITNQTTEQRYAEGTRRGICESLNEGGCPPSPGNPTPTQGLQGANNALQNRMDAFLAALGAADLAQGQTILGIVRNTNAVVNHAEHGLAKIQNFASTAWKVTQADKVMAGVTMALTIHNAMMLSNNLLATISEATNMTLDALGIRDETDSPIDFGAMVRGKISSVLTSILGAEQYAALTARIAKANRIYQASVNLLDTTQSLFDSARSVAELTAENTGKIGNALRDAGVVYEDAYEEFAEEINPQNRSQRNLEKFRGTIEGVSEVFETVEEISSNVVEFQQTAVQLKEEKEEWQNEYNQKIEVKVEEKLEIKAESTADTDVEKVDFSQGQVEEQ